MAFPPGCFFLKDVQSSTMPSTTIPALGSVCDQSRAQSTNIALHLLFHLFSQPLQQARKVVSDLLFAVVGLEHPCRGLRMLKVYLLCLHLLFAGCPPVRRGVPRLYSGCYKACPPVDPRLAPAIESAVLRSSCQMIVRSRVYPCRPFEDDRPIWDKNPWEMSPPRGLNSMGHVSPNHCRLVRLGYVHAPSIYVHWLSGQLEKEALPKHNATRRGVVRGPLQKA